MQIIKRKIDSIMTVRLDLTILEKKNTDNCKL